MKLSKHVIIKNDCPITSGIVVTSYVLSRIAQHRNGVETFKIFIFKLLSFLDQAVCIIKKTPSAFCAEGVYNVMG